MANSGHDNQSNEQRRIGRRGVLKGAVATGVGVAAWSAPSITSLGGTPVYAGVCTQPIFTFEAGYRNTDCGGCNPSANIRYKNWSTQQCPGPAWGGTATLVRANGTTPGGNGLCPPDAYASITGIPANQFCAVRITIRQGNCDGTIISGATSPPLSSDGIVQIPPVDCGSTSSNNLFTRVQIVCSTQVGCIS